MMLPPPDNLNRLTFLLKVSQQLGEITNNFTLPGILKILIIILFKRKRYKIYVGYLEKSL